ncbi:MAG: DUF2330 domain-containing protein [Polyangiaceae bacterium]|nr:DUF2330 domain-containing protein [Polyangiaceae bacterium]
MAGGDARVVEQRLALSASSGRVALWSQVRLAGTTGEVAIVLPVADGAQLDWGSRAFFESLEVATAPRIVPPAASPGCPGEEPEKVAHVAGDVQGSATLEPIETAILDNAAAVTAWADQNGLVISPGLSVALQTAGPVRFFVARFPAPRGSSLTKALRVVTPGALPTFPLVLTQAQSQPVDVVLWSTGAGRATLEGNEVIVDTSDLVFDVGHVTSNYDELLANALGSQASFVYQAASHEALRDTLQAGENGPDIDSVIRTYFDRAATYGDATGDPSTCATAAAVVLGQNTQIGTTCPRTALGVAGGAAACTADTIDVGEVDPALLRCGPLADDVAVLLSDLVGADAWLTRTAAKIPVGGVGADRDVTFVSGNRRDPVEVASGVDLSGCGGSGPGTTSSGPSTGSGGPSGAGPSAGSGTGQVVEVPVYAYDGCACGGEYIVVDYEEVAEEDAPEGYYVDEGDGCSSDASDTYVEGDYSSDSPDDCSGESYDASDSYYDDGCGCDAGDADDLDSDGCSCDAGDSGASADACSCGEGIDATGDSCGGEDCAVKPERRPRRPNKLAYISLGVLIAWRRGSRRLQKKKRS